MGAENKKGQILIELAVVMGFVLLIILGALVQFTKMKDRQYQYQLTTGSKNGKMAPIKNRH